MDRNEMNEEEVRKLGTEQNGMEETGKVDLRQIDRVFVAKNHMIILRGFMKMFGYAAVVCMLILMPCYQKRLTEVESRYQESRMALFLANMFSNMAENNLIS